MGMRGNGPWMRLTHMPTGLNVRVNGGSIRNQNKWMQWAKEMCRLHLASKLAAPKCDEIRRTYDLKPPLGIEAHIRNGTYSEGLLANGYDEIQKFFDGNRPDLDSWQVFNMREEMK